MAKTVPGFQTNIYERHDKAVNKTVTKTSSDINSENIHRYESQNL